MTPTEQIDNLIKQLEKLYHISSVNLGCAEYNKFHKELVDFISANKFEDSIEWQAIKEYLVYTPTQFMVTSEAKVIMTNLHELKTKVLTLNQRKSRVKRIDVKWWIGIGLAILGIIISFVYQQHKNSQSFEGATGIGTNIVGDNASISNNQIINNIGNQTIYNQIATESKRDTNVNQNTKETVEKNIHPGSGGIKYKIEKTIKKGGVLNDEISGIIIGLIEIDIISNHAKIQLTEPHKRAVIQNINAGHKIAYNNNGKNYEAIIAIDYFDIIISITEK